MTEGQIQAAPGSALSDLRARREQAKQKLHLDLRIPRLEPPVFVRYAPLEKPDIDEANAKIAESKDRDREVVAKSVLLAKACLGVFERDAKGRPKGDPASWPKFDQQIGAMLELPADCGAVEVVRGLYLTDGDVIVAMAELADWSAKSGQQAAEEYAGN
ncbi:hypothetical protein [Nocardioides sp. SR21]|uniref:hypothetical protein n=1 Tax=Nocardioides sp. SR21 TaxID=2919501 RepID=UPI001FA990C4|nr:hypothetical protein [Nocardioides sp. SR21]